MVSQVVEERPGFETDRDRDDLTVLDRDPLHAVSDNLLRASSAIARPEDRRNRHKARSWTKSTSGMISMSCPRARRSRAFRALSDAVRLCACLPSGYVHDIEQDWWVHYYCGCGSTSRAIKVEVHEEMHVEDHVDAHSKHPRSTYRGGRRAKPALERWAGDVMSDDGIWRIRQRVVDRGGDWYEETVLNPDGSVRHHEAHPLSQHTGHGSDRRRQP